MSPSRRDWTWRNGFAACVMPPPSRNCLNERRATAGSLQDRQRAFSPRRTNRMNVAMAVAMRPNQTRNVSSGIDQTSDG